MNIGLDILEYLANPFMITDSDGKILRVSKSAESLIRLSGQSMPAYVSDIFDSSSSSEAPSVGEARSCILRMGDSLKSTHIFPFYSEWGEKDFLYLFDSPDVLKGMDFDLLLDHIDESIIIYNKEGVVEHVNKITEELTGFRKMKGKNPRDGVRYGDIEESITIRALETKKPLKMNVRWSKTGKTVTYTSIPFLGPNGEVEKVINTGRDVTKLLQLQEDLQKTADLKDHYLKRLSTLESLVGISTIVHSSDEMKWVVSTAIKAAKADSPVFIFGESGAGKEVVANLIHSSGDRNKRPFVGVNCSAIPSELLESELFGYEEGAFTGARRGGKKGLLEEASDGTIFLDEITEIPLQMQSKLLRVLEEQEFRRVGSILKIPLKARIVSASNMNNEELADSSKFRRDLFYRLNVIPIYVPPLRERRDDIFPLTRFFLKNINIKYNTSIKFSLHLMAKFYNYNWPGNVRELKNMVERLVVMAEKDEVDVQDYRLLSKFEQKKEPFEDGDISISKMMSLKTAHKILDEILIKKAMKETGKVSKAARLLGINPCTIFRKIKSENIRLE